MSQFKPVENLSLKYFQLLFKTNLVEFDGVLVNVIKKIKY